MSEEKNIEDSSSPVGRTDSGKPTPIPELKKDNGDPPETNPTPNDLQPATDNMEVHKHPHNVMHKKKWGEYLLEFLMIFFAVFLGFLAENMREHKVEHARAKEFAVGLIRSLNADIGQFHFLRDFRI